MAEIKRQVSRILAIGGIPEDQVRRFTKGESFACCYGSESEHRQLTQFCTALQDLLASMGQQLSDYSPEELQSLLTQFAKEDPGT